jgi:predicted esterase
MFPEEEFVANGKPPKPKPALLCLHGGGTNSMIFNIQTVRIQRALAPYFEFVFLDGPLEGEPGPGVMPIFEGFEPYRRWHVKGVDFKPAQTVAVLQNAMDERRRKDGRGFVGALGFSQGARVVAGLLLEQQMKQQRGEGKEKGLAFGVMFNGTTPPLAADLTDSEKAERIGVPCLHVVGTDDPWREEGLQLYRKHFDPQTASLMEFKVGHRLPVREEDTAKVTSEILRMYAEAEGGIQIDLAGLVE